MSNARHRFNNELRRRDPQHEAQTALTPAYVLGPVRRILGGVIDLDPCTTPDNPTKATRWIAPPDDGLAAHWSDSSIYVNPPYGLAREPWVEKAIMAAHRGARVVVLIPAATETKCFHRALRYCSGLVLVRGRLRFGIPRKTGQQMAASHPSALFGFNVDMSPASRIGVQLQVIRGVGEVFVLEG